MDSENSINKADFFLREIPVKASTEPVQKKAIVKEELQYLSLTDSAQEKILDTLRYIHGNNFSLGDISDYKDLRSNLSKKYWVGHGNLHVKGGCDFSAIKDDPKEEEERLRNFALLRLESYGFHRSHCVEAFKYCDFNIEDSLYLLYNRYLNLDSSPKEIEHELTEKELLEQRTDEKSSLESIYENGFTEKIVNEVWILTLKLDYLVKLVHKDIQLESKKKMTTKANKEQKQKCWNFKKGHCKFGDKCRFSHEVEVEEIDPDRHLKDFVFELEIRFPPNTKYPFVPPIILLKTNAVFPKLLNLHICKRLYDEAKILAEDGIPCVYTVTELLKNEEEISRHLKTDPDFLSPTEKLFAARKLTDVSRMRPSHYKKGDTNKNKTTITPQERIENNLKVIDEFNRSLKKPPYLKMLQHRKQLPAWNLMKDIVNSLQQTQVLIVSGETGCGKSTQVPQFILDDWLINYTKDRRHVEIICTQPRRISAIGVAERVADERYDKIGNVVGYQVRLENKMSAKTRLTFCTTGILLRRLQGDPMLPNVSHVIVDEVHERSEESDFLLLILRDLLRQRPDLKVILMSATMNAALFSKYFGEVPIINIPGRTYPVTQIFLEDVLDTVDYIFDFPSDFCKKLNPKEYDIIDAEFASFDATNCQPPKSKIRDENLSPVQTLARYKGYSLRTCKSLYVMNPDKINNDLIEEVLTWIVYGEHDYPREGSILIFLPGIGEITSLYEQLYEHKDFGHRGGDFLLLPLHSSLTNEEQSAIFRKPKHDERKIILSTNIAETSVTIDDCVFVIDTGKMKEKHFDSNRNMESLEMVWVTRANALQRKGRAGRVMSGVCIHLYTSHRFQHQFLQEPVPEIHRIPLEQLILNIKVLENFENREVRSVLGALIDPPVLESINSSINRLKSVGALDNENALTPLGQHLATLPVDVRIGKLMLYGAIFHCLDASLTMAACLSYKSPFVTPFGKKEEATRKKRTFATGYSDHITILKAYQKWLVAQKKSRMAGRNFARESYLSQNTLETIGDVKHQFLEYLVDIGFVSLDLSRRKRAGIDNVLEITGTEFNRNGENTRLLSAVLCAALYPNVIKVLTPPKTYIQTPGGAIPKVFEAKDLRFHTGQEMVFLHPGSVNYNKSFPSPFLVYQEKIQTSKIYIRDCTLVPIIPLVLFSGYDLHISVANGNTYINLDGGWIIFQVDEHKVAEMMKMIRYELVMLLEEKIQDPLLNLSNHDRGEKIISTILYLISL